MERQTKDSAPHPGALRTPVTFPWRLPANHWLSRTLQILLAVGIGVTFWAKITGRDYETRSVLLAIGGIFLAGVAHLAWQMLRNRGSRPNS